MKYIELTQGKKAIVDDDDYERVNQYKWFAAYNQKRKIYDARTHIDKKIILMSRFIMNAPVGFCVDHKNHNTLDNRKCNLRICTQSENSANMRKAKNRSSKYKGVSICHVRDKPWRAQLRINNVRIHLGCYATEEEAAKVYDKKALEIFGEYALTNFSETIS